MFPFDYVIMVYILVGMYYTLRNTILTRNWIKNDTTFVWVQTAMTFCLCRFCSAGQVVFLWTALYRLSLVHESHCRVFVCIDTWIRTLSMTSDPALNQEHDIQTDDPNLDKMHQTPMFYIQFFCNRTKLGMYIYIYIYIFHSISVI